MLAVTAGGVGEWSLETRFVSWTEGDALMAPRNIPPVMWGHSGPPGGRWLSDQHPLRARAIISSRSR